MFLQLLLLLLLTLAFARPYLETRAAEIIDPAPLSSNLSAINNYLTSRRNVLFNTYSPSLIPTIWHELPSIRCPSNKPP